MTKVERYKTGGNEIEYRETTESVDRWFAILGNDIQRITKEEEKPINSIEPNERNRLLGDYFKKMSEIAEIEGRLIDLPIRGINNREQIIISSRGKGLYVQEERVPETDKTRIEFNFFGKDVAKTRLERAVKIYPNKINELNEESKKASGKARAEVQSRIEKLKISEGRCRVLLEQIFGKKKE